MSDMLFGATGLVIFLSVAFVGGYLLYKFKNARMSKAWGSLVQVVNGKVVGDGGGGATSWLVGTYKGRKVQASMVPDRNVYSSDSSSNAKYNYFEVALADEPGKQDWSVIYDRKFLGMGQEGWRVQSKDPSVETGLKAGDIVSLVASYGEPASHFDLSPLEFVRREGLLRYRYDAGTSWTPSAQVFAQHLDMLLKVAEINKRVNPA